MATDLIEFGERRQTDAGFVGDGHISDGAGKSHQHQQGIIDNNHGTSVRFWGTHRRCPQTYIIQAGKESSDTKFQTAALECDVPGLLAVGVPEFICTSPL